MQKFDVVSSRGVRRQLYALSKLAASRLYRCRFSFLSSQQEAADRHQLYGRTRLTRKDDAFQ
jgi:hypothetical protein